MATVAMRLRHTAAHKLVMTKHCKDKAARLNPAPPPRSRQAVQKRHWLGKHRSLRTFCPCWSQCPGYSCIQQHM